jgi:hypothetical protein
MLARRQVYELHAELAAAFGRRPTWTLFQLLRTANGSPPFAGRQVEPADLFELYGAAAAALDAEAAWTLLEILREAHHSELPDGTPWPAAIQPDPEA